MHVHLVPAYLDPGTGSLIIQTIIGAVLGTVVIFKNYWMGAVNRLRKRSAPRDESNESDDR